MYYVGLDLGRSQDFTAISVIERLDIAIGRCPKCRESITIVEHHLRHIERVDLGTPYTAQIQKVDQLTHSGILRDKCLVLADATGCGAPVIDLLRDARISHRAILITAGTEEHINDDGWLCVPKVNLVSNLQILLQSNRLKLAKELPGMDDLLRELLAFQANISDSGRATFEARQGEHDDLVLSVALACWYSEKHGMSGFPEYKPVTLPLQRFKTL